MGEVPPVKHQFHRPAGETDSYESDACSGPYPGDDLLVLLAPHGARAEEQVPDEADHQRDRNPRLA
jgi:hypothetical protein